MTVLCNVRLLKSHVGCRYKSIIKMYIKLCRSPDKRILIAIENLKIAVCMSNSGRRDHESLGQAYSRIKRFLLFKMTGKLFGVLL